jgi:allophanate hydrolase subunit 1
MSKKELAPVAAKIMKRVTKADEKAQKENREHDDSIGLWVTYDKEGSTKLAYVTRTQKIVERPYDCKFLD